jgi:hypothetical protein
MRIKATVFAVIGIAMMSFPAVSAADDIQAAHAVVRGPMSGLYDFHQKLKKLVGSNFDKAAITCEGCDELQQNAADPTVIKVDYIFFRDDKRLKAFIKAWRKVQAQNFDARLTIAFDLDYPVGDCSVPQPCVVAPFCKLTPGCDKVKGAPCTACGP